MFRHMPEAHTEISLTVGTAPSKRALVVQTGFVGDVVLATALFAPLQAAGYEVHALVRPAAMALVPPGAEIPAGSVVMGVPGRVVASRDNFARVRRNALLYHRNALAYAEGRHDAWRGETFAQWRDELADRLTAGEDLGV